MHFLGLSWIDCLIIACYVLAILSIGKYLSGGVTTEKEFFLGGRTLGKWFQFFLSFGSMADASQATTTSSSVYLQGAGGAWLGLITLFLTPYYWFSNVWFRRVRLTTMGDLFEDRFGRKFLSSLYAITTILIIIVTIAAGNVVALKTLQPLMVKEVSSYTAQESESVNSYNEFVVLRSERNHGIFSGKNTQRFEYLKNFYDRGELHPYITYLKPVWFYVCSSALVAIFVTLGGLKASAMVDAIQALLVILISVILIPFGLLKLGGVHELHRKVPDIMFNLFGGGGLSEYTWYSIGSLLLIQCVGIIASQANMTIAGSAKNEFAARIGAVTGGFSKRFVTIAWAYCGLIALALFGPNLADPDQTWGLLTKTLLPAGLIGFMIIGILGGKMALLGSQSVVMSGLLVKNIYEPLFPNSSEKRSMLVARLTVPFALGLGICIALYLNSIIALLKFQIVLLVIWGVPISMLFLWRRLTEIAVRVQVLSTLFIVAVIPWIIPNVSFLAQSKALTLMTYERTIIVKSLVNKSDITHNTSYKEGDVINRTVVVEPVSVFFEEGVVKVNPKDPSSVKTGRGLFRTEVWIVSLCGFDLAKCNSAQLMTIRYLVDAILPIIILIVVSLLSQPTDRLRVDRFYVRLKTPVANTPDEDEIEILTSYANLNRFNHTKLFPKSNWEFTYWNRQDTIGFLSCCGLIGFILIFFKAVLMLGS
jgi:Na+/proline symporter